MRSHMFGMFRRSVSFMLAGTLAAIGLDGIAIPIGSRAPTMFVLVATFVGALGLLWLADEIADSWAAPCRQIFRACSGLPTRSRIRGPPCRQIFRA
jgi:hypothetical protein